MKPMQGLFCPITEDASYHEFLLQLVRGFMHEGWKR